MRKLVFINRFYYPDNSATAQLLTDLTRNVKLSELKVYVITSRFFYSGAGNSLPKYEALEGVEVYRAWSSNFGRANLVGRSIDYLSFYLGSLWLMIRLIRKNDIVVSKTDPPLVSVLAAFVVKMKGALLINWLQDVFPEVGKELGIKLVAFPPIYSLLRCLRNNSLRVASYNVVLGEAMAQKIISETREPYKVRIIPNWKIGDTGRVVDRNENNLRVEWGLGEKFIVGYSGNLGRAHDYLTIFEVVKNFSKRIDIAFLFIGGGVGYNLLKEKVIAEELNNAIFKPYQPVKILSESLSISDIHLVSLEANLEGLIVPSKFYGIISVGRPVLFIGSPDGELGSIIEHQKCGASSSVGDVQALTKNIELYLNDSTRLAVDSENARKLYDKNFSPEISKEKWFSLLKDALYDHS